MKRQATKVWDVIVIGGGPAGMMAAARAAERGRSVLLLEKNKELGKKLSITGGGRCNVTNNKPAVRTMLDSYKGSGKFLFSTFTQHGVSETIAWFGDRNVPFVEENEGRLFPFTKSAETIRNTMMQEVKKQGVMIVTDVAVTGVAYDATRAEFVVSQAGGEVYTTTSCVVATGGTSRPETGSTGEGFDWLRELGHTIIANNFALVPLALADSWVAKVSGVTLEAVKITLFAEEKKVLSTSGRLLFTHVGVSGPMILNLSSTIGDLLQAGTVTLQIDFFPEQDEGAVRKRLNDILGEYSNRNVNNILSELVPKAIANVMLELLSIASTVPGHSVRTADRSRIARSLKGFPLTVKGLLGADKAVISSGGVALEEIDFKTMSSKKREKLFLVGDVLNIDRPSGGYGLQLCWSTGYVAGSHA